MKECGSNTVVISSLSPTLNDSALRQIKDCKCVLGKAAFFEALAQMKSSLSWRFDASQFPKPTWMTATMEPKPEKEEMMEKGRKQDPSVRKQDPSVSENLSARANRKLRDKIVLAVCLQQLEKAPSNLEELQRLATPVFVSMYILNDFIIYIYIKFYLVFRNKPVILEGESPKAM